MLSVSTGKINYDGFDTCRDSLSKTQSGARSPSNGRPRISSSARRQLSGSGRSDNSANSIQSLPTLGPS